ncbi:MAG: hypothetical protein F4X98_18100 [Gammaproteobacteria bacterium]|nr:hypothetical protein [Gammaproteobacteria bacterium]
MRSGTIEIAYDRADVAHAEAPDPDWDRATALLETDDPYHVDNALLGFESDSSGIPTGTASLTRRPLLRFTQTPEIGGPGSAAARTLQFTGRQERQHHMTMTKGLHRPTSPRHRLSGRSLQKGAIQTYRGSAMMNGIFQQIDKMGRTPRSGVTMCHRQRKTAVYLSHDRKHIIEEPPHGGPIKRTLRDPKFRGR